MRAVIQRVDRADVRIDGNEIARIEKGILALIGFHRNDTRRDLEWMAKKIVELRIFNDQNGKLNLSLQDICGDLLLVSQFTVYGDCRKGRRPSYSDAAPPEDAQNRYEEFVHIAKEWIPGTRSGKFQAMMDVSLLNSGPVTLILDSHKTI